MERRLFSLGARLSACASLVRNGKVLADVGTDHAYLPIWLVSTGEVPKAYAADINESPLQTARRNISDYGLEDKIVAVVSDGLDKIPPDCVDDIVMAGIGGDVISDILQRAPWLKSPRYRLILQPMSRSEKARERLYKMNFNIIEDCVICEADKLYNIICAEYNGSCSIAGNSNSGYSKLDTYVGKLNPSKELEAKQLRRRAEALSREAEGLERCGRLTEAAEAARLSDEILNYILIYAERN